VRENGESPTGNDGVREPTKSEPVTNGRGMRYSPFTAGIKRIEQTPRPAWHTQLLIVCRHTTQYDCPLDTREGLVPAWSQLSCQLTERVRNELMNGGGKACGGPANLDQECVNVSNLLPTFSVAERGVRENWGLDVVCIVISHRTKCTEPAAFLQKIDDETVTCEKKIHQRGESVQESGDQLTERGQPDGFVAGPRECAI
jgi:hypothetical protein